MSIKSKVFAAAATLALVGGVGAHGYRCSASAATPSCGNFCVNIFSHDFGTHATPELRAGHAASGREGRPAASSCSAPRTSTRREDYTFSFQGRCPTSTRPAWCPPRWPCTTAVPWVPFAELRRRSRDERPRVRDRVLALRRGQRPVRGRGRDRGAGRQGHARSRVASRPRPCGSSTRPDTVGHGYVPLINGSDTNFSQPFVLTYPLRLTRPTCRGRSSRHQPDRVPGCERVPDRHHQQQPAVGCRLRRPPVGNASA